ncbi:MAG: hypothetical protein KatS3mg054_0094 [Chloroflexus sp.]|nr:MAG: hypothetical protein KatS3mg054_0094 [Chloroflexus sp.]
MHLTEIRCGGFIGLFNGADVSLALGRSGLVVVTGPNGSGKTTLMELIQPFRIMPSKVDKYSEAAFSFYGHVRGRAYKELSFCIGNEAFISKIEVDSDKKITSASVTKDDGSPFDAQAGGVKHYDQAIRAMACSPKIFFSAYFIPQGQGHGLLLRRKDLAEVISELADVETISKWNEVAAAVAKYIDSEVNAVSMAVAAAIREINIRLTACLRAALAVEQAITKRSASAELTDRLMSELSGLRDRLESINTTLSAAKQRKTELEMAVRDARATERRLSTARSAVHFLEAAGYSCSNSISAATNSAARILTAVSEWKAKYEDDVRKLASELGAQEVEPTSAAAFLSRQLSELRQKSSELLLEIQRIPCKESGIFCDCPLYSRANKEAGSDKIDALDRALKVAGSASSLKAKIDKSSKAAEALSLLIEESSALNLSGEARLTDVVKELQSRVQQGTEPGELAGLSKSILSLEEERGATITRIAEIERTMGELSRAKADLREKIILLHEEVIGLSAAVNGLITAAEKAATVRRALAIVSRIRNATSPSGAPLQFTASVMGSIVDIANNLLSRCYHSPARIEFSLSEPDSSGRLDIELLLTSGGYERPVASLSGGEKLVVNECMRRAIAIYGNTVLGLRIETLWSDESDHALDSSIRLKVIEMKRYALDLGGFQAEYIVSHSPEVLSCSDSVISLLELAPA